jgi:hypothetical protein
MTEIKQVTVTKYEAADGVLYDTPEEAGRANLFERVESIHERWCTGYTDRDRDPALFVVENIELIRRVIAPELEEAIGVIVRYQEELDADPPAYSLDLNELRAATLDELWAILVPEVGTSCIDPQ